MIRSIYPTLRKAKIVYNFGLFECNRVNSENLFLITISDIGSRMVREAINCHLDERKSSF